MVNLDEIKDLDPEVKDLCAELNHLPGIETTNSCCGHEKEKIRVWFRCYSWKSLGILARCTDRNYSSGKFKVLASNSDVKPLNLFYLESEKPMRTKEMETEIEDLIKNIRYWSSSEFDDYFVE